MRENQRRKIRGLTAPLDCFWKTFSQKQKPLRKHYKNTVRLPVFSSSDNIFGLHFLSKKRYLPFGLKKPAVRFFLYRKQDTTCRFHSGSDAPYTSRRFAIFFIPLQPVYPTHVPAPFFIYIKQWFSFFFAHCQTNAGADFRKFSYIVLWLPMIRSARKTRLSTDRIRLHKSTTHRIFPGHFYNQF